VLFELQERTEHNQATMESTAPDISSTAAEPSIPSTPETPIAPLNAVPHTVSPTPSFFVPASAPPVQRNFTRGAPSSVDSRTTTHGRQGGTSASGRSTDFSDVLSEFSIDEDGITYPGAIRWLIPPMGTSVSKPRLVTNLIRFYLESHGFAGPAITVMESLLNVPDQANFCSAGMVAGLTRGETEFIWYLREI
jgi:hypothetical protein